MRTNMIGPSKKYENLTTSLPYLSCLNPIEPRLRIGFIGDLMRIGNTEMQVGDDVLAFFEDVDYIVGNLEGVLLDPGLPAKPFVSGEKVSTALLSLLKQFNDPSRIILSCANNHAGDYGEPHFRHTVRLLEEEGFQCIGRRR